MWFKILHFVGLTNLSDTQMDKYYILKKIEKLKERIKNLNEAIALQVNKIEDTLALMILSRDENIVRSRMQNKNEIIEELANLKRELLKRNKLYNSSISELSLSDIKFQNKILDIKKQLDSFKRIYRTTKDLEKVVASQS